MFWLKRNHHLPELKVRVDAKKKIAIDNVVKHTFASAAEMIDYTDRAEVLRRTRKTGFLSLPILGVFHRVNCLYC